MPEFEQDGSPKVELILGRRKIEDKRDNTRGENVFDASGNNVEDEYLEDYRSDIINDGCSSVKRQESSHSVLKKEGNSGRVDYEYLIKYKGVSYIHLEWKAASELESMNKSAKTLYRRFLKKLHLGNAEEDHEDPDFDPSHAQPHKIVDEGEHEVFVELSDKELVEW
jgi:hypothetical protein